MQEVETRLFSCVCAVAPTPASSGHFPSRKVGLYCCLRPHWPLLPVWAWAPATMAPVSPRRALDSGASFSASSHNSLAVWPSVPGHCVPGPATSTRPPSHGKGGRPQTGMPDRRSRLVGSGAGRPAGRAGTRSSTAQDFAILLAILYRPLAIRQEGSVVSKLVILQKTKV